MIFVDNSPILTLVFKVSSSFSEIKSFKYLLPNDELSTKMETIINVIMNSRIKEIIFVVFNIILFIYKFTS